MEMEYREEYIHFGLRVQYYRKLQGMTQEALNVLASKLFED